MTEAPVPNNLAHSEHSTQPQLPVMINVYPPMANMPQFPQYPQNQQQPNYQNQKQFHATDPNSYQNQQQAPSVQNIGSNIPEYYCMHFYDSLNNNTTDVELLQDLTATPETKNVQKWRPKHVEEYLNRIYEDSKNLPT